jgi:choline dehydrogenase-like flavoprotein
MSRPPFENGAGIQPPGTSLHLTGATRMGTDRAESVVTPDCQVWDFDNLYVGGLSVLPECIASNPTFTCSAIAVRSAASILNCTLADLEARICPSSEYQDPGMPLNRTDV